MTNKYASRETSPEVAAKAGRVLNDATSTPDERAVAASALAQAEARAEVKGKAKRKAGRPSTASKVVEALEDAGMTAAADAARAIAGIPPRPLSEEEAFLATVVEQVDGGLAVGFNCKDEAEAEAREALVKALPHQPGRFYRVIREKSRLEIRLLPEE